MHPNTLRTRAVTAAALAVSLTAVSIGARPVPAQRAAPLPQLDSAQLVRDLFVLAADSMEGRSIGTPGGARARAYLLGRLKAIGLAPLKDSLQLPFTSQGRGGTTIAGVNLVGIVRGTRQPDSYIVLSGHYDHVGVRNGLLYPGADDNASGTSAVVAIATWLTRNAPTHSVIIALFDGEESGLMGARAFVANPPVPLERIVANVNLDMVSRNDKDELWAAGGTANPVLRPLIAATMATAAVKLKAGHDSGGGHEDWTTQSDHGAFHAKGIPWVYFGVEDHADYHKPTDFPDRAMPGFFYRSTRTIADFLRRLDAAADEVAKARRTP